MILGIDIGTSTLSFVLADEDGRQVEARTLRNESARTAAPHNRVQDPEWIFERVEAECEALRARFAIDAIGIACQMHGILYVDASGHAVSPLYTWQDESGLMRAPDGRTWLETLNDITGAGLVKGIAYGSVTHFVHTRTGHVPAGAVAFCGIGDYVGMRLCGQARPKAHVSNASGFGLYDLEARRFDADAIVRAGMRPEDYPELMLGRTCVGFDRHGAPVSVSLGDNQASFLGAVADLESEMLINLGTGGQISCCTDAIVAEPGIETRPLLEDSFLAVSTSHCAGRAYAALERFFREVLEMAGKPEESLYALMNAEAGQAPVDPPMRVETTFCGSRTDPDAACAMRGITLENFTPRAMIQGFMAGVCEELYPFYEAMSRRRAFRSITGSGNLIRRNTAMQATVERVFGLPLRMSAATEETAMGAARFARQMIGKNGR